MFLYHSTNGLLTVNTDYTISPNQLAQPQAGYTANETVILTGTGNYSGTIYFHYVAIPSDFGGNIDDPNYGTASNPFLITNLAQLNRLAAIVNGDSTPMNSTYSTNSKVASNITASTYANGVFAVTANISTFTNRVGILNHVFSGTIYGVTSASNLTKQARTITLGITGSNNYVGLFGYTSGAKIA